MNVSWLTELTAWLRDVAPPYVQAAAVVLASVLMAKAVGTVAGLALRRASRHYLPHLGDRLSTVGRRTIFRTIALAGLLVAAALLPLSPGLDRLTVAAVRTLLILVWITAGIRGGSLLLTGLSQAPSGPLWVVPTTVPLINNLLRVTLALVAAYAILIAWRVDVTGLVASAGIVGLALSFAAQDTLGNLFAGAAILVDQPYRIGDYIVLDSGERGRVTYVGLRSTRMLTRDDEEVSIPNGLIGRAKIINESGGPNPQFRLRVKIGVAYGSDIDHVMAVLLQLAASHQAVCRQPDPRVRLRAFSDSSIDFELLVWIADPALRGLVLHELNCELYRAFAREGIVIPFPQRDVHLTDDRPSHGSVDPAALKMR